MKQLQRKQKGTVVWEKYIKPPSNSKVPQNYINLYVYINPAGDYSFWLDYLLCRAQGSWIDWEKNRFSNRFEAIEAAYEYAEEVFYSGYIGSLHHIDALMCEQLLTKPDAHGLSTCLLLFD